MEAAGDDGQELAEVLRELLDWDGRPAKAWLTECFRLTGSEGAPGLGDEQLATLARLDAAIRWGSDWSEDIEEQARAVLPAAISATRLRRHASGVFALYLRHLCEVQWELTSEHLAMTRLIRISSELWQEQAPGLGLSSQDRAEADLCWDLLGFLVDEFHVETALFTGALDTVAATVGRAHERIAAVADRDRSKALSVLGAAVTAEADAELIYFRCLDAAARSTCGYLARELDSIEPAIREIEEALTGPELEGVDASEIRSYLTALHELHAAAGREWIHVDEGRLVVLYPFGLRSPRSDTNERVVEDVLAHGEQWVLGGLTAVSASALDLSDSWQGHDPLGRGYGGVQVVLPDLELRRVRGRPQRIDVSLQFSRLGNHSVRFELPIEDAGPALLAELAGIANPVYGDLHELDGAISLVCADDPEGTPTRWSRLADVAESMIAGIAERFAARTDRAANVSSRPGLFSVIAVIDRATVFDGVADRSGRATDDARALPGLFGVQPLVHPVPAETTSFADWSLYDLERVRRFPLLTLNREILAANANSALLASFRSPSYRIGTVLSFLEFAHSLAGMYAGWQDEVARHAGAIATRLDQVDRLLAADEDESLEQADADELQSVLVGIERAELALQRFVQSNQATMLFIESPAIVTSAALRVDLDAALESSGYRSLRDAFLQAKEEVLGNRLQQLLDLCHRRIADRLDRERARQTAGARRMLEAVGIGIAVIGLSGLLSILQVGYDISGWWSLVLVLGLVALAVAFVVLSWRATRTALGPARRRSLRRRIALRRSRRRARLRRPRR